MFHLNRFRGNHSRRGFFLFALFTVLLLSFLSCVILFPVNSSGLAVAAEFQEEETLDVAEAESPSAGDEVSEPEQIVEAVEDQAGEEGPAVEASEQLDEPEAPVAATEEETPVESTEDAPLEEDLPEDADEAESSPADGIDEPADKPAEQAGEPAAVWGEPAAEDDEAEEDEEPADEAGGDAGAPHESGVDTTPPHVKFAAAAVKLGKTVTPSTFIIHYEDESSVSFRFAEDPDTSVLGEYPITIIAEDARGNSTVIETTLYVCDSVIELELENRTYTGLRLREMVGTLHGYHPSIQQLKVKKEGASSFELTKSDKVIYVGVQIRDTTRPKAKAVDQICYLGYPKPASDFVTEVSDVQDVTIEFLKEPDWDLPGEREVRISVTDASYNRRIVKVNATFKRDDIAPQLVLNVSPYHYVGDAVAYMKGVSAKDNLDPDCVITVDKSQVKYRQAGTYPVTYTATDRDGNSSSKTVEISFREPSITDEELDELAESILGDILKDKMSVAEKIKAIYDFCRYKIRYTGNSDKTDWKGEAYRGLTEFKGDCFTYYSAAFLLLNKIDGVEVMSVERIGGRTHHYWCLVNIGTGWYHYDTCPNHIYGTCFMRTNKQILNGEGKAYWKYDMSQFPEVATKSFKMF